MRRILFITPDYASHYFPMSALADSLSSRGYQVIFATGTGLEDRVRADGFDYAKLVLGPGSNAGLMKPEQQSAAERVQIEKFFEASQRGMVPTLLYQARNRLRDLLWEPQRVAVDIEQILETLAPHAVVVDQLSYGATAALRGLDRDFIAFHPGHPSAISVDWPYGYPPRLPRGLRVSLEELEELKAICQRVVDRFTSEYNAVVSGLNPDAEPVFDAFAATSSQLAIVNYPSSLGLGYGLPSRARFIGSSVRRQSLTGENVFDLNHDRPRIFVTLGSFFSARSDLLRKIVASFRNEHVELVVASGTTPRDELEPIPAHWTVEPYLPQPALLRQSDLVVTHGGNNTVTEALTAGIPLLVGPLSTDQFAGAADIERAGLGRAFDPNFDSAATIADLAHDLLRSKAVERAGEFGVQMRSNPGEELAANLVEDSIQVPVSM